MVVVVAHEPSSRFLGQGFVLVERHDALEFHDVASAEAVLAIFASEPCFVVQDLVPSAA